MRFTIALWTRANAPAADYPTIASNKDWYSGEIRDYTERSNYGFSRTSGQLPGWAIALQPNGALAWNLGDGTHRLDYQPTASQRIDDGSWHLIAFSVDANTNQAHLYFDGRQVALYSLTGLEPI
ncbi:MAG: LamG-like jellyroll fold domain-containing protein, partial [Candidatus Latescibacterota bacterium]|nr:LamG-like jellyroll fold domain-containing protein [Candidatus Latescibacterota bacterium]